MILSRDESPTDPKGFFLLAVVTVLYVHPLLSFLQRHGFSGGPTLDPFFLEVIAETVLAGFFLSSVSSGDRPIFIFFCCRLHLWSASSHLYDLRFSALTTRFSSFFELPVVRLVFFSRG